MFWGSDPSTWAGHHIWESRHSVGINSNFVQITKFPEGFLKMKFCKQGSIFHWGISYILGNVHTLDPFLTQSKLNPIVQIV